MPGALVGRALGAYGKKPVIPKLAEIDPNKVQGDTLAGNAAILPGAAQLAGQYNKLNADNLRALFEQQLPGQYGLAQENTLSLLKGQVPQDVQDALQRTVAARAIGGGYGGTGMASFDQLRHFGISSLKAQEQGLAQFDKLQSMFPRLDIAQTMFFTPQQRLAFAFQDRAAHFSRDLLAAQVKAAPNPADAALAEGLDNDFAAFRSAMFSYLGGGMGGMGGGGAGAGAPSGGNMGGAGGGYNYGPSG